MKKQLTIFLMAFCFANAAHADMLDMNGMMKAGELGTDSGTCALGAVIFASAGALARIPLNASSTLPIAGGVLGCLGGAALVGNAAEADEYRGAKMPATTELKLTHLT